MNRKRRVPYNSYLLRKQSSKSRSFSANNNSSQLSKNITYSNENVNFVNTPKNPTNYVNNNLICFSSDIVPDYEKTFNNTSHDIVLVDADSDIDCDDEEFLIIYDKYLEDLENDLDISTKRAIIEAMFS